MNTTPKKILITMGDPAGIGPEIIVKALAAINPPPGIELRIVGEWENIDREIARQQVSLKLQPLADFSDELKEGSIGIHTLSQIRPEDFQPGHSNAKCGLASYRYFEYAIEQCKQNLAHGIVTAPISKEALHQAGLQFVGHTDILEQKVDTSGVVMSIVHPKIIVTHVTDHMPLRKALDAITPQRLQKVIELTYLAAKTRNERPRVALAGINPHAGEAGVLGREEIELLKPVMETMSEKGFPTLGPFPGDTVFRRGLGGEFEAVIAMYHDQGFGPMKTVDMENGVNCTLGLPFVRTSPDHGTAFDLAGKGLADPSSMKASLTLAIDLVQQRQGQDF